jgi:hypothetical protein
MPTLRWCGQAAQRTSRSRDASREREPRVTRRQGEPEREPERHVPFYLTKVQGNFSQIERNVPIATPGSLRNKVEALAAYVPLSEKIDQFWLNENNREADSWTKHLDINMVMLATSLTPEGFLMV